MKQLLITLLIVLAVTAQDSSSTDETKVHGPEPKPQFQITDTTAFITGIVKGTFNKEEIGDFSTCFTDIYQLYTDVTHAVDFFKLKNFEAIRNGIESIGEAIEDVAKGLGSCSDFA